MGTESEQNEDNPLQPPTIVSRRDFVEAYDKLVLQAPDVCSRCKHRDILRIPTLQFLRTVEPSAKLGQIAREVLQQNAVSTEKWEPAKALEVCKNLEDLVLRLLDQPWRKEFHTIKLYSGYFRTTVMQYLTDADRLLEQAGYQMDISGHKMVLPSSPSRQAILVSASEIYLLGLECQIYREIMCLVQVERYSIANVSECRFSIACNNEEAVAWIKENCKPGKANSGKKASALTTVQEDPIYAEISDSPKASPASSRKSIKSSLSSVNNDSSPSTAGLSNSNGVLNALDLSEDDKASVKSPEEPIYSVVKKPAKKQTKTPSTGSPKAFTKDEVKFPPVNALNGSSDGRKQSPRKNRGQDSGYISKPNSQDLGLVEDGSFVRVDIMPKSDKSPVENVEKDIHGQYGFDCQGLRALRGSPQAAPTTGFKAATADEHQMKSLQSVLDSSGKDFPQSSPKNSDWGYVQDDLEKRFGHQHILGERGDILEPSNERLTSPGQRGNNPMGTFKGSNVTFSTFRPLPCSPKLNRTANIQADCVERSSSPYENICGNPSGRAIAYEVKRPPVVPASRTNNPGSLTAIPVKLPTAPALESTPTTGSQNFKKSFTDKLEKRQSFYDNLPREETDSGDLMDIQGPDNVLRLLEHTKERIEKLPLQSRGEGVNCVVLPTTTEAPSTTFSAPCYYSVPHNNKKIPLAENKPRQIVTAPVCTKPTDAPPQPPPHMHMMGNHWQCEACTSFNLQGTEICDICGKSRLKGAEQAPLVSGGPQCPKCTLINEVGASMCEACDYSFDKGVPTYI